MIFDRFLKTLLFLFVFSWASGQDLSNKGTEFWVGYGYHHGMTHVSSQTDNEQDMVLYFTSDENTSVKVEIPGLNWSKTYQVSANSVTESDPMPKTGGQDARLLQEQVYNTGIHITSDRPIVAYAHIYNQSVSGATLLFPVTTLGQDYYSLNFTQRSFADDSNSWAYVIATEDNTAVEITPSANTLKNTAGKSFTITLNKGQIYNIMGKTSGTNGEDLTGTRIRSISQGTAGCKKIAVFSGSGRLSIYCGNDGGTSDNVIQQVFPSSAWGKKFLTVPTAKLPNNYFRIAVTDPSTIVTVDGTRLTNLVRNFYYDILANSPKSIVADKPIMVAQYITSTDGGDGPTCGNSFNSNGDPEMIYLSPVEQTIDKITLNSTTHFKITSHYINVVIKSSAVGSFLLDGKNAISSFVSHPMDPSYSYAVFTVGPGAHQLVADSGFNAIAYGYGITESYGYNAGTNIKDLYQFLTLRNQYATVNLPVTCRNTKSFFSITLPYKASSITWDFGTNPKITPNQNVTQTNPGPDSSYVSGGRTLNVYSLPSMYSFTSTGTYPVKITASNQTADGCNGIQQITYNVTVTEPPIADFTVSHAGCITDSAYFTDASSGNGRQLLQWRWQVDAGPIDTVKNPHKGFTEAKTYNIKHTAINDLGCSTDTTRPFTIAPQPTAIFSIAKPTCAGSPIPFTDASTVTSGKIVKWYWDFGNGNKITNTVGGSVNNTYSAPGDYLVTLQVENETGCKSQITKQTVTVNPSPAISFDMPGACLPAGIAVFENRTSISDGTANSIVYSWNFGDGGTSTDKSPVHKYATAGPFSVTLKATSINGCAKDSTRLFSNVYPQPVAVFKWAPSSICVTDSVRFTDGSSAGNSTVQEWFWNFGDGKTSSSQHPVHKFADSGTYIITLVIKSTGGCFSDTARQNIYVNKSPTAAFTISGATCENQSFTITDQSKANSGVINNWFWSFADGTSETHTNGNSFSKIASIPGDYAIDLIVQSDKGCKSEPLRQTAAVRPLPIANFIVPDICVNDPYAAFKDSSYIPGVAGASSLSYKWEFGDGTTTSTAQNPQHKYVSAGNYQVTLTVTSSSGCIATKTKQITVSSGSPKADFTLIDDGTFCNSAQVRIKNDASVDFGRVTKVLINWDSQNSTAVPEIDETPVTGKIYTHTFPANPTVKTYQVKLTAFSGTNCYADKIISITVNPSPKVSFSPVAAICISAASRPITEAKETTGINGTFVFSGRGVTPAGVFNPAIAGAGTASVKYLYTSTAGCADSATQTIEVIPDPVVRFSGPVYILEGGTAELAPLVTGNIATYLWSPATYLSNPNVKSPSVVPQDSITYKLTVTTAEGCQGTGQVTVTILKSLGIPTVFSPNGDGINDLWNIPSLASYPDCTIEVFNRFGTIVFRSIGYSKPWNGTFNGSSLPVGVYYYIVNPKNGRKPYTGNVTILR